LLSNYDNKAAGEREGVRPASHYNEPPQKNLIIKFFGRSSILKKCSADEAVQKVCQEFLDKLNIAAHKSGYII